MVRLNCFRFLVITFLIFSLMGCASAADSTTLPTQEFSRKNDFGDGYVAHVPIADVKQKDPKEIVNILMTQWLEHCKAENAYPKAMLKEYKVDEITISNVDENKRLYIQALVMFSVVPVQSENWWWGGLISFDDPWLHLKADFGVFISEVEGPYYWLEATPARG